MSITIVKQLQKLDLPPTEKNVAIAFALHLWENDPSKGAWVGRPKLAAESGFSESAVDKAMAGLREKRILILEGYKSGARAKMPIYTVHPENWHQSAFWASKELVHEASSSPQDSVPRTPSNGVCGLDSVESGLDSVKHGQDSVRQELDSVPQAPDKELASYIEKERKRDSLFSEDKQLNGQVSDYSVFGKYADEVKQLDHDLAVAHREHAAVSAQLQEPTPPRTSAAAKNLAVKLIGLCGRLGAGSFSVANRQSLIDEIMEYQGFSEAVWRTATTMIVNDLSSSDDNGFHLGHAGTKIPGTIASKIASDGTPGPAVKQYREDTLRPTLMKIITLKERRNSVLEQVDIARTKAEEDALVETCLGEWPDGLPA